MEPMSSFFYITKIIKHHEICDGYFHPISSQIDLSNYCNLSCMFCTHNKDHLKRDVIDVLLLDKILKKLFLHGCKGIEYTGGGEPLTHPDFEKIIIKTHEKFDVGLVTNGTLIKKYNNELWSKFDWIRVSINSGPKNYLKIHSKNKFNDVMDGLSILDKNCSFFGISYIYSGQDVSDVVELIIELRKYKNLKYIRIEKDVLKPTPDRYTVQDILSSVKSQINPNVSILFQINRDVHISNKCMMYKIKPRIDVYGNFYPCCVAHYKKIHFMGSVLNFDFNKDVSIDTNRCPYCLYGCVNDFCLEISKSNIKNKNFV